MIFVAFKIECRDYLTELRHSFCCTYPSRTKVPSVVRELYTCYALRWTIILNLSPQPFGKVTIRTSICNQYKIGCEVSPMI